MKTVIQEIADDMADKAFREHYVESNIKNGIPFQILAMRNARNWTQKNLAQEADTQQTAISRAENPNYGNFNLSTLKKIAAAFDVALIVRFIPFSKLLKETVYIEPEDLRVPSFKDDKGMQNLGSKPGIVVSKSPLSFISFLPNRFTVSGEVETSHSGQPIREQASFRG